MGTTKRKDTEMYDTDQETELPEPRPLHELCHGPVWGCVVHGPDPETGWTGEPTTEELTVELVWHLWAALETARTGTLQRCPNSMCGHCHEEMEIAWHDIEGVNLYEQHCLAEVEESCDCRHHPRLARAVARYQVDGICPVCDGDYGRHLSGCPFMIHLATRPRPHEVV